VTCNVYGVTCKETVTYCALSRYTRHLTLYTFSERARCTRAHD